MTANPFSDTLYRVASDEDTNIGKTFDITGKYTVPTIKALAPTSAWSPSTASSTSASPASTAPSTPPPSPLSWSAADLTYLLTILYPYQTSTSSIALEAHRVNTQDISPSMRLELVLHTPSTPVAPTAFARTAPIGTGRPSSRFLVAAASGTTFPLARKALAYRIIDLCGKEALATVITYYQLLADLHALETASLFSLHRGIGGMKRVDEWEWNGRREQIRAGNVGGDWGVEARLEGWLLEGSRLDLGVWGEFIVGAGIMGMEGREEKEKMYSGMVGFLGVVEGEMRWR